MNILLINKAGIHNQRVYTDARKHRLVLVTHNVIQMSQEYL